MSRLSLNIPMTVGAKLTANVQLAAGVKVWPEQVSFRMLKGAANGLTNVTSQSLVINPAC